MPQLSDFNNIIPDTLINNSDRNVISFYDTDSNPFLANPTEYDNSLSIANKLNLKLERLCFGLGYISELFCQNKRPFIIINKVRDLGEDHKMRESTFAWLSKNGVLYIDELELLSFDPFTYDNNLFTKRSKELVN